jgi:hypothetical protein
MDRNGSTSTIAQQAEERIAKLEKRARKLANARARHGRGAREARERERVMPKAVV